MLSLLTRTSTVNICCPIRIFVPTSSAVTTTLTQDSNSYSIKPFDAIPGFKRLPIIGSAWVYFPIIGKYDIHKMHRADMAKYLKHGDFVREKIGRFDLINLYNPNDVQYVLQHEGEFPNRGSLTSIKAYRTLRKDWFKTPGVLAMQDKEWYNLRSKTQPYIMKPKLVHSFMNRMQDISRDLVQLIRLIRDENNEVKDTVQELYKWALESSSHVALDIRLGCLETNLDPDSEALKMINAVQEMFLCINKMESVTGTMQYWKYFPSPTWKRFVKASDYHYMTCRKYINSSMEVLKKTKDGKELTLLQSLLSTPDLDISDVMTTITDLYFAGVDTTSNAEGFLLYYLAKNPESQKKLYQEIQTVLPSSNDRITPDVHNELRYTKACLKEALRLTPILRGISRKLDKDIVVSGYKIPAGVIILCMMQIASRLEKNFPKADQFIPERWLDKDNKPHPYAYLPFGVGRRSCIGRRLAEQEVVCATTEIIRNFVVEYTGDDFDLQSRLVNSPDIPLRFKFIDRI